MTEGLDTWARSHQLHRHEVRAAYFAVVLSLGSLGVSFWALTEEHERLREELARQVVFVEVSGPVYPGGGQEPVVGETSYTVANFGPFPVENVVLETGPTSDIADVIDKQLGNTPTDRPKQVQAVDLGTVGPCQSASVPGPDSGETYVRAVFSDIDGRRWAKAAGSPPDEDLPDAELERVFPYLGSEPGVEITPLPGCVSR